RYRLRARAAAAVSHRSADRPGDQARLPRAGVLRPGARGSRRATLPVLQVPHDGPRRRAAPVGARESQRGDGAGVQDPQRSAHHARGTDPAPVQPRRAAPVHQRPAWRHEPRRPAAAARARRLAHRSAPTQAPIQRAPGHHLPLASVRAGTQLRGVDQDGHGVHRQLVTAPGLRDPREDHSRGDHRPRGLLTRRGVSGGHRNMSARPAVSVPLENGPRVRLATVSASLTPPVSVVVPCYDEAEGIPSLLERLETMEPLGWEFVFVDDGSGDATFATLLSAARTRPWMRVVKHGTNLGLGAAMRTGFAHAHAPIVCTMDSDCTYLPERLPELVRLVEEGADIVTASPWHPDSVP